jgi:hypothetical protein
MRQSIFRHITAFYICLASFLAQMAPLQATPMQASLPLEGHLCKQVYLAYGRHATRRDALLYQEHFCNESNLETGYRQFTVSSGHKTHGDVEYLERKKYSPAGQLQEREAQVSAKGKTETSIYRYSYDSKGRLKNIVTDSTTGPIQITREYSYSEQGRLETETYKRGAKIWTYTKFAYDSSGRKIGEDIFSGKGSKEESAVFDYDKSNRLATETHTRNTTGNKVEDIYTYGEGGRLAGMKQAETSGQSKTFKTFYYDYAVHSAH